MSLYRSRPRCLRAARTSVLILLTLLLAAPAAGQRRDGGSTVVIAAASDLQALNSLVAAEGYTNEVVRFMLFLPLVQFTPDLQLAPALARRWEMLGDTAVVFHLRRDVFWHDGRLTTAHDVAFTFRRAVDPATAFPNVGALAHWTTVQVVDSFTVRFRMTPHADPLLVWPGLAIMPRHLLEAIPPEGLRTAAFNRAPVGNGPFRFVSVQANDRWIFDANPRFPQELGGPPLVDRIVWRVVPDNSAQLVELLTGRADMMLSPRVEQARESGARPDVYAITKPSRRYNFIGWNGLRAPFDDARVRRALMMAIDRQTMIDVLRQGFAQLGTGPIAPYHWAFDQSLEPLPFDTAAARALLAAAGFTTRARDGVLMRADGRRLEFELKIAANSAANRSMGEMIQSDLRRIGVAMSLRPIDFASLVQDVSDSRRNFDAFLMAFETDIRLDLRDAFHSAARGGPFQSASYSNPEVDRLLDQAGTAQNRAAALPHWHRLQRILRDEQPWGILWYPPELILVRRRVQDVQMDIRGTLVGVSRWRITGSD
jgi:peptide/nickel transport system substrate-binding protein